MNEFSSSTTETDDEAQDAAALALASRQGVAATAFYLHLSAATPFAVGPGLFEFVNSAATVVREDLRTAVRPAVAEYLRRFEALVASARDEDLEDGKSNQIERRLPRLWAEASEQLLPAIAELLRSQSIGPALSAEICKALGYAEHRSAALWLLENALTSRSAATRDAAGVGLALAQDKTSIPALARAVSREPIPELRRDLQAVLDELRAAHPAAS
jgi:hypothetical protein